MSCGLEFFSTEVNAAPPKVIAHVPPNELYKVSYCVLMRPYQMDPKNNFILENSDKNERLKGFE
jgi:hypothetical protein